MDRLERAHPDVVRRIIAGEWLRADAIPSVLGSVRLRPHQLDAARRVRGLIQRNGGALLGDEVGLGKTYVALAIAGLYSKPLVVAPASLRAMWLDAAGRSAVTIRFVSLESLSRALPLQRDHDFIVIDEAHHFRTASTARYRAVATLAARVPVLLVSATPVHNKAKDLTALIELFLGSAARALSREQLACLVVRRGQSEASDSFPRVREPVHLDLPHDPQLLEELLALPPPIPPQDGGMAAAIVTRTLVRLWASSDAALREGLRKRLAKAIAIREALEAGHYPTRHELAAWTYAEGSVQLGFAHVLAPQAFAGSAALLGAVSEHERKLAGLLAALPRDSVADAARAEHLRALRRTHASAKIVAFSQFSETVAMYYRTLACSGGTAMLTSRGARIASGAITRREALERFAPASSNAAPPNPGQEISLLIATDLLSEGVNLQDASVIVHLDLPWTAATLEQRVGRAARLGSRCRDVFVYSITPPAASAQLLRVESIIRRKTELADASVGASRIPPLFARAAATARSEVEFAEALRRALATWAENRPAARMRPPLWAAVMADRDALLALVTVRGRAMLLASDGDRLSAAPCLVREIVERATGASASIPPGEVSAAYARIRQWIDDELASDDAGHTRTGSTALARRIATRLARQLSLCPRHQRPRLSERVAALQRRIQTPLTLGVEHEIDAALRSTAGDVLEALERIIQPAGEEEQDNENGIRAMLILTRGLRSG